MSPRLPFAPLSTYRLQLHSAFTFEHARSVCDYLAELGVSHVYVSPILRAERGSPHGYNVCAYDQLNPELGGEAGFRDFSDELRRHGLRLLVDFVPNHMGVATGENAWWNDVLENGPSSRFADFFDIDWERPKASLHARVLYPILGAQYGESLENGEIILARAGGQITVRYYDHELPVSPRSLLPLFELALAALQSLREPETASAEPKDVDVVELLSIVTATRNLPEREETAPERRLERAREKEVIKCRLAALAARSEDVTRALDDAIVAYNGRKGDPASFDRLDALLREQSFRLSYWRVASEEINYRRFFDINDLAAVRMDLPPVFERTHAYILALAAEGRVDGLRLDHPDGLRDPAEYFSWLRRAGGDDLYLLAEKILEPAEHLPRAWAVDGTTGYDALALLGGLWIDSGAENAFTTLYRRLTADTLAFEAHAREGKRTVIRGSFGPEVRTLALALERIAEGNRRSRDFTLASLHEAIVETIVAFGVYRTYLGTDGSRGPNDDQHIVRAVTLAKRRDLHVHSSVFDFLRSVLLLREGERTETRASFVMRFQQLTGPIMAKGVEDTAFYRYGRFVALNEVGGDPARFGRSARDFHGAALARLRDWPFSMVASSTHDMKRSEDVRARLAVLTELPERWEACVESWMRLAEKHRRVVDDMRAPSDADLYLFFQTAFGAWPFVGIAADPTAYENRLGAYVKKAAREAKVHGSWIQPNIEYERALVDLVHGLLADEAFVRSVGGLADETATYAASNSLAQVALKIAGPGVADTYQGSELWNFSLVDPDNRTEVDFAARRSALRAMREGGREDFIASMLARFAGGEIKLYVTRTLLRLRRQFPALHLHGSYTPIDGGEHIIAFVREHDGRALACIVPRLSWKLTRGRHPWPIGAAWGARTLPLPQRRWTNVFIGEQRAWAAEAQLRDVLRTLPVAVLVSG